MRNEIITTGVNKTRSYDLIGKPLWTIQGRFYVLWDFGFFSARNAADGSEVYPKERLNSQGKTAFTASP